MCPLSGGAAARPAIIIPEGEVEISVAVVCPDTVLHHVPNTILFSFNRYLNRFFCRHFFYDCDNIRVRFCTGPVKCDIYVLFFIMLCLLLLVHLMTLLQL